MSEERTRRIQERAHALWEREGRPHGRDAQHWSQAERDIVAEDDAQAVRTTGSATERRARKPKPLRGEAEEAPKARQGRGTKAKSEVSTEATLKAKGSKPKAVAKDSAETPKPMRGRKTKTVSEDATAGSTTARGRKSKTAAVEETAEPGTDLAQEPSGSTEAPHKTE